MIWTRRGFLGFVAGALVVRPVIAGETVPFLKGLWLQEFIAETPLAERRLLIARHPQDGGGLVIDSYIWRGHLRWWAGQGCEIAFGRGLQNVSDHDVQLRYATLLCGGHRYAWTPEARVPVGLYVDTPPFPYADRPVWRDTRT